MSMLKNVFCRKTVWLLFLCLAALPAFAAEKTSPAMERWVRRSTAREKENTQEIKLTVTYYANEYVEALVSSEAEKNLWYHRYSFAHWDQSTHKSGEKRPKTYESPKVKTHTLRISAEMKPLLAAIWDDGISSAVDPNPNILFFDGVTYEFFADKRRANTRNEKNAYVVFANALKDAILAGDRARAESLIGEEFQRVLSELHLDIVF